MSRSRRKKPFASITVAGFNRSDKEDKRRCNQILRSRNKQLLAKGDDEKLITKNEALNVYTFRKDGKRRFDPKRHPDMMRK